MTYSQFLDILSAYAEEEFAAFQRRLILTERKILGVRTPIMRKIAKEHIAELEEIFTFPDEYYEVVFIKLTMVSSLPYSQFLRYLDRCVALMDNWALCDCFKNKEISRHKEEFLAVLRTMFTRGGEYEQRYPLVVLLSEYAEEKYLPTIEWFIKNADTSRYYVHMAVAWLIAELLIKEYKQGVLLLSKRLTEDKTHNKAIQKAIESYRLTKEQKDFLRSLKIRK